MKKSAILLTVLLISLLFGSCIFVGSIQGNGKVTEETRDVGDFDKISVTRGMNVYISQGNQAKVVVKADDNLLKVIDTYVSDGTLKVTCTKIIRNAESNKVFVTVPDLKSIKTTAGSNVFSETPLKFEILEIKSTAGSNLHLTLEAGDLNVNASAGSNQYLDGTAKMVNIKTTSGSNIKAGNLLTENCTVKANSGANVWVNSQKKLNVSVSSGGNVHYSGENLQLDVEKSSGGNVFKN